MIFPIDKYLAQDYRNTLRTGGSPQMIDDSAPVTPVIDIQKGFPKPNAKQILHQTLVFVGNASTTFQIATVSATTKIYYLGMFAQNQAAVQCGPDFFDASSGVAGAINGNNAYQDYLGRIAPMTVAATVGATLAYNPVLPYQVTYGLRLIGGGAGQSCIYQIWWLEEIV